MYHFNKFIKNVGMHKDIKCLKFVINHNNIQDHRQVNSRVFINAYQYF